MFSFRYSFYKSFIVTSPSAKSTGNSTPTTTIFTSAANSSESKPALLRTTSGNTKFTANPDDRRAMFATKGTVDKLQTDKLRSKKLKFLKVLCLFCTK